MTQENQNTFTVIAEEVDYLIINKPAGLMVHGDGRATGETLVDQLLRAYPEIQGVGEDWTREAQGGEQVIPRSGIVHRLDRDTSGVMIIPRTQEFFDHIKKQFQEHTIAKVYRAFVYGSVRNDTGTIDAPIGKSSADFRRWSAQRGARGMMRSAITDYRVLHRFTDNLGNNYSYVEFRPQTGRTHQIRVHAKYMNHPIVADTLYAGKLAQGPSLDFARHALHAVQISLVDLSGKLCTYEVPLPPDFQNAVVKHGCA